MYSSSKCCFPPLPMEEFPCTHDPRQSPNTIIKSVFAEQLHETVHVDGVLVSRAVYDSCLPSSSSAPDSSNDSDPEADHHIMLVDDGGSGCDSTEPDSFYAHAFGVFQLVYSSSVPPPNIPPGATECEVVDNRRTGVGLSTVCFNNSTGTRLHSVRCMRVVDDYGTYVTETDEDEQKLFGMVDMIRHANTSYGQTLDERGIAIYYTTQLYPLHVVAIDAASMNSCLQSEQPQFRSQLQPPPYSPDDEIV